MVTLMFITKKGRPSASERVLASVLFGQYGERGFSPLFRCFVSILRATCGGQNTLGKILSFPQIPSKKNNQVKIMNFEKSEI